MIFRRLNSADAPEINAFKAEFAQANSSMDGTGILFKSSAEEWLSYIGGLESRDNPDSVPCLQYGLFEGGKRMLGTVQIRLGLKGYLTDFGGHIGYSVRPSERRRGYAKLMLRSALDICRAEGLDRVLVTCLEDNIGSAKTIEACGGVFEGLVYDGVNYKANMKRYRITL